MEHAALVVDNQQGSPLNAREDLIRLWGFIEHQRGLKVDRIWATVPNRRNPNGFSVLQPECECNGFRMEPHF
jgi:hypothetical protein